MSGCTSDRESSESTNPSYFSKATLVTMDITGADIWVVPLTQIIHFDYGSRGKLIVSTQHGLYEADSRRSSIDKLKKPTTGRVQHLLKKNGHIVCFQGNQK